MGKKIKKTLKQVLKEQSFLNEQEFSTGPIQFTNIPDVIDTNTFEITWSGGITDSEYMYYISVWSDGWWVSSVVTTDDPAGYADGGSNSFQWNVGEYCEDLQGWGSHQL